jgi:NitT/TauT family transport system permease protein
MKEFVRQTAILVTSITVGLLVWEGAAHLIDNPVALVAPSLIFARIYEMFASGEIWPHLAASGLAFAYGYGLAVVCGVALGLALSELKLLRTLLDPWFDALYATPMIVFAPVFIVSMGIGISSKVAVVFLVSFFPIVITTITGAQLADPKLLDMARAFGFSRTQITLKVRMPFALPTILAGLRVASARGLIGVVVGELFGARAGLGYVIYAASQTFDTVGMYAGGVILMILGIAINVVFRRLETYLAPWKVARS